MVAAASSFFSARIKRPTRCNGAKISTSLRVIAPSWDSGAKTCSPLCVAAASQAATPVGNESRKICCKSALKRSIPGLLVIGAESKSSGLREITNVCSSGIQQVASIPNPSSGNVYRLRLP